MSPTSSDPAGPARGLRADARRNRERLVAAAMELFVDEGVEVPLDAIADRAGVGIGTLYRRFPDRYALAEAVALEAFTIARRIARGAIDEGAEDALRRFLAGVVDERVGVLLASLRPVLLQLASDELLVAAFDETLAAVSDVVDHAHGTGELRDDVTADDVLVLLAMHTQPLPGLPRSYVSVMTPRLLHLTFEGLRPSPRATQPPPAPSLPAPEALRGSR